MALLLVACMPESIAIYGAPVTSDEESGEAEESGQGGCVAPSPEASGSDDGTDTDGSRSDACGEDSTGTGGSPEDPGG